MSTITSASKKIKIKELLQESWQRVPGFKEPIILLSFLSLILWGIFYFVLLKLVYLPKINAMLSQQLAQRLATQNMNPRPPITPIPIENFPTPMSTIIIVAIILFILGVGWWFLVAMRIMLGVRRSIGLSIKIPLVFAECKKVSKHLYMLYLIIFIIAAGNFFLNDFYKYLGLLGTLFKVLVSFGIGYIVTTFHLFSIPLIITKRYSAYDAIQSGVIATKNNLAEVILFVLSFSVILNISAVLLCIPLIWTLPMYYIAIGIFFRDAYGLKKPTKL